MVRAFNAKAVIRRSLVDHSERFLCISMTSTIICIVIAPRTEAERRGGPPSKEGFRFVM